MATATRTRVRYGLRSTGLAMTPEEYDAIPLSAVDRRFRYELIRGVLVVSPFAGPAEIGPNDYLGYLLQSFQEHHPNGSILDATLFEHYIHSLDNRRRCDRAIWVGLGRVPDLEADIPAIVVEFVSKSRRDQVRDYEEKRAEYLVVGVREYWIIDRFRRTMTVHRPPATGVEQTVVGEADTYRTDLLPGFELPLASILRQADLWPPKRRKRARPEPKPPEGDPR